jgi:hypothetical protein
LALSCELLVGGFAVNDALGSGVCSPLLMLCSSIFASFVSQAFGFELLLGGSSCLNSLLELFGNSSLSGLSDLFSLSSFRGEVLGLRYRCLVGGGGLRSVVEEAPPVRAAF